MINPPFPYNVTILRRVMTSDPFQEYEDEPLVIYEGCCDFENSRLPVYKDGVQVGKYKLYLPDNIVMVEIGDEVELNINNRLIKGVIVEFFPTNFGLTISWDNANN